MKKAKFFLALALTAAIFLRPQTAVSAAQQAMRMWYTSVAPALFPFLALMPLLTGREACMIYEKIFAPFMRPLFNLPGTAAPAVIISMISGSPAGAIAVSRIAGQGGMTKSELRRLAPVICGVGPAYLVMGVGVGLYGSAEIGMKIAAVQILVQLVLLVAFRFMKDDDAESPNIITIPDKESGIRIAVESTLTVCGYMVIYSVASSALSQFIGKIPGIILLAAADLPSGMAAIANLRFVGRAAAVGMAVGFGGICIITQNMDALRPFGLRWKQMLSVKFAQSALCGAVLPAVLRLDGAQKLQLATNSQKPYAFSLLIALILSLPLMIYLSNKLFLNKRKSADIFSS